MVTTLPCHSRYNKIAQAEHSFLPFSPIHLKKDTAKKSFLVLFGPNFLKREPFFLKKELAAFQEKLLLCSGFYI